MGSVADCYDNALAESVFATIECERWCPNAGFLPQMTQILDIGRAV